MVNDKWCHNQYIGLEDFFVGGSKYSEENLQKNDYKIYGTYLNNILATLVMVRVL